MLTCSSALVNVLRQIGRVRALVVAVGVSALKELEVAGTGARFWVHTGEVVLEIWILP